MQYRKKPEVGEAMQWTGYNIIELDKFCTCHIDHYQRLVVQTSEGTEFVPVGNYILKDYRGRIRVVWKFYFEEEYDTIYPYDSEVIV